MLPYVFLQVNLSIHALVLSVACDNTAKIIRLIEFSVEVRTHTRQIEEYKSWHLDDVYAIFSYKAYILQPL